MSVLPPLTLDQTIECLLREERGRILASLTGSVGNMQLAEDALQDAAEAACLTWRQSGLPTSPVGWLITTARRKAIDQLRRQVRFDRLQPALGYLQELETEQRDCASGTDADDSIPDKRLELMFVCCHPALDKMTRVALTLRTLGGLATTEIARAFLIKPSAMAQRLVRARHKVTAAGIAYEIPTGDRLPERLEAVLSVIYFIFNEGYSASSGPRILRTNLSDEAIRLGRILLQLMPSETEVAGLLALMILHDSRRDARQNGDGAMVSLERQNRKRWDQSRIREGTRLLKDTLTKKQPGPYQLQAAISAVHSEALDWQSTDWVQIVALYEVLHGLQPGPVVRLNQAVAVSYACSAAAAVPRLEVLAADDRMQCYQPFLVAFADVLFRSGQSRAAIRYQQKALAVTDSVEEHRFLAARLAVMQGS